mgnify:CR=1 FL=1
MPKIPFGLGEKYQPTRSVKNYPQLTCYWEVLFDNKTLSAFEVSGLNEKLEYVEYRNGSNPDSRLTKRLTKILGGTIKITWGIFDENENGAHLYHIWRDDRLTDHDEDAKINILVILKDENRHPVMSWNCTGCYPVEYQGPTLKGDVSEIATQTLIIQAEKIKSNMGAPRLT